MIPEKNRRFFRRIGYCLLGVTVLAIPLHVAGYRINETESLPSGIWRIVGSPGVAVRGDIVNFCPPDTPALSLARERGYLHDGPCPGGLEPLFKPVVALGGDRVELTDEGIRVNGVLVPNSAPIAIDGKGEQMPHLERGVYRVDPGKAWMVSSYTAYSFDSRYFGPVDLSAVAGRAIPVWIMEKAP